MKWVKGFVLRVDPHRRGFDLCAYGVTLCGSGIDPGLVQSKRSAWMREPLQVALKHEVPLGWLWRGTQR
jgi:hypothetical protein